MQVSNKKNQEIFENKLVCLFRVGWGVCVCIPDIRKWFRVQGWRWCVLAPLGVRV